MLVICMFVETKNHKSDDESELRMVLLTPRGQIFPFSYFANHSLECEKVIKYIKKYKLLP